ncbi:DUF4382 domain-containing protein [Haloferax sp. MBLA0077]|uniref:DUF4382 domain-containing protein n=3 Tax=Haloferacaceae TaxID=1644056 RepID=A0A6G1Z4R2_9EURY|nr:DUF4382 domain-containing protein [Haloferax sp. CBA1149]MRW81627.1 DUF4382 domain-containing protein [Haloferax marinisediminis]
MVALLVVLAGCAGGAGTLTESPQSTSEATAETTDASSTGGSDAGESGTVNFYVSDEENAIGDFEHLNVTIERVTFVRADGGADDSSDVDAESSEESTENESDDETATAEPTVNESNTTVESNATAEVNATANATVEADAENESEVEAESEAEVEAEAEAESDDGGKVTYEVENVTVDLTELKGDNATLVGAYDLEKGNYNAVHVHVTDVNGTLKTGEKVNIKLPSNKLKLNSDFVVEQGGSVDFVFDITAFEAGGSGKYILKPVISESGTDVPITNVDEDEADEAEEDVEDEDENEATEAKGESKEKRDKDESAAEGDAEAEADAELNVTFDGNVTAGENATLVVTQNGTVVENASVMVNDEVAGSTDANGTLVVEIPATSEVTVKVTHDDAEAEVEFEFEDVTGEITEDDSQKADNPGKSDNSNA